MWCSAQQSRRDSALVLKMQISGMCSSFGATRLDEQAVAPNEQNINEALGRISDSS